MTFRYLSSLCLLWVSTLILIGCGGGGGDGTPSPSGEPAATRVHVEPGVYVGTLGAKEFVGILTPASWNTQWYGLHYASSDPLIKDPNIYTGPIQDMGSFTASVSPLSYFPINSSYSSVLSGTAAITAPASGQLKGDLNLAPHIPNATFNAAPTTAMTFNQAANLQDIAGSWTGRLSYGAGTNGAFTFNVSATGDVSAANFGVDCRWTTPHFQITADATVNLFKLNLAMTQSTACDFSEKTLAGLAFVMNSPAANKTQRLIWVATTPTGQGMSFKADR